VDVWPQIGFQNWQNSHSLIGSFEDLDAASVEDVAKFFRTYYAPNNAVLVLSGDIDAAEAKKLVEAYFGDIPPQPQPKHPDLAEPAEVKPRHEVHKDPLAQVPAVVIGYPGPARRSPDYYALAMMDVLLTGGESSRFQQNLVKGRQSVIQFQADLGWPFAGAGDFKDPGHYAMMLLHNPAFKGADIVEQAQGEIGKIQKDGVDAKELARVKTYYRASVISRMQSSLQRARMLGQYEMLDGNPDFINTEMASFLAVTPAEIQAAARKYCVPERRFVLEIVPTPAAGEAEK
jgi:predicted Zn-dependent peptidase